MEGKGKAFATGGCGCVCAFALIAGLAVMVGGTAHLDLGGAICLFVTGGLLGLVILAIYSKGRSDANADALPSHREEGTSASEVNALCNCVPTDCPGCGRILHAVRSDRSCPLCGEPLLNVRLQR